MKAYQWLGNDGYEYLLFCTREDAEAIISIFGGRAKAPTLKMGDGVKYSYYLVNTRDGILTPLRHLSWVFGGHADPYEPLVGRQESLAVILDRYRFQEYPFRAE